MFVGFFNQNVIFKGDASFWAQNVHLLILF